MITVMLMGGLGNQMFQFAAGFNLASKLNSKLQLNTNLLESPRNINERTVLRKYDLEIFDLPKCSLSNKPINNYFLKRQINKLLPYGKKSYLVEKHFHYDPSINSLRNKNLIMEGYWQSPKYFEDTKEEIKLIFRLSEGDLIQDSKLILDEIKNSNSICLNVRRGDFVNDPLLGTMPLEYYRKAINYFQNKYENTKFFIFSDDIEWCENNFKFLMNKRIVGHEHKGYKFKNYLILMKLCKHFIIPNSTFAWWSAFLAEFEEKEVIVPEKWFKSPYLNSKDLIPGDWKSLIP